MTFSLLSANIFAMFQLEDVLQLKDAEDVKLVVRRHPVTLAPGLLLAALLIVVPFFFLFRLFGFGIIGVVIFGLSILVGAAIAVKTILLWNADVFIITTLRVVDVDQRGLFARFVTEAPLATIQDVSWNRHGIVDTLWKIGSLKVQTVGTSADILVRRVAHPERIHELLNDLRHTTVPARVDLPPDQRERLRKLMTLLEVLPPASIDRIEQAIKDEGKKDAVSSFLS